ncbi:MAG: hypothetical protein QOE31_84 [Solirubrobacteraceae bacterium]|jgi:hypothetical protein|nr:hypothetical protein [Solirubrobacteraceae bacterium]
MKKLAAIAAVAAVGLVAPAQAHKPDGVGKPDKPAKAAKAAKGRCGARSVGFNASGTLVTATLTAGEAGRYSGTISIAVTRANHGAPKGEQTYTLTDARVRFRNGVDAAAPAAGSRVKLSGKITKLTRKCPTDGFEPAVTVARVDVKAAKTAGADEAKDAEAVKKADA